MTCPSATYSINSVQAQATKTVDMTRQATYSANIYRLAQSTKQQRQLDMTRQTRHDHCRVNSALKLESLRLGFTFSKPSLRDSSLKHRRPPPTQVVRV